MQQRMCSGVVFVNWGFNSKLQIFKLNRAIKDSQLAFWPFSIVLLNIDNLYHKYMDRGASWQLNKFWYLNNI